MGGINYVNLLGEGYKVLDSKELHEPVPVLLGEFFLSLTPVIIIFMLLVTSLVHSLIRSFMHEIYYYLFTPFMDISLHSFMSPTPLSSSVSWLGKGIRTIEEKPWYCWLYILLV
jgi:hypothetical protein